VDFVAVLDQVIALLRQRGRITYRPLQRQSQLDEVALEDLKEELLYGQRLAVDEDSRVLVWSGETGSTAPTGPAAPPPLIYTPPYLAEKIVMARPVAGWCSKAPRCRMARPRPIFRCLTYSNAIRTWRRATTPAPSGPR
jgi:hypothetical protein